MKTLLTWRRSLLFLPGLLLVVALLALACSDGDDDGEKATATEEPGATATPEATVEEHEDDVDDTDTAVVDVSLVEFSLTPSADSGESGSITFNASNDGLIPHNFYVFRSDLAPDQLPVENAMVPEEGAEGAEFVGETETFDGGATVSATFDLTPGKYVFLCNVAGHYQAGMFAGFTVN